MGVGVDVDVGVGEGVDKGLTCCDEVCRSSC